MTDKKTRGRNFSEYEKNLLTELVKAREIVLSKNKDSKTLKQKEEAWKAITDLFNADEKVTARDEDTIKLCVKNMTNRAKLELGKWRAEINKTGGGTHSLDQPGTSGSSPTFAELMPSVFQPLSVADSDLVETSGKLQMFCN